MNALRQKRRERGLTLHQVANSVGLAVSNLSRIERGQQSPRPSVAVKLYRLFDKEVPLEDILNADPAAPPYRRATAPVEDRAA